MRAVDARSTWVRNPLRAPISPRPKTGKTGGLALENIRHQRSSAKESREQTRASVGLLPFLEENARLPPRPAGRRISDFFFGKLRTTLQRRFRHVGVQSLSTKDHLNFHARYLCMRRAFRSRGRAALRHKRIETRRRRPRVAFATRLAG